MTEREKKTLEASEADVTEKRQVNVPSKLVKSSFFDPYSLNKPRSLVPDDAAQMVVFESNKSKYKASRDFGDKRSSFFVHNRNDSMWS